MREADRFKLLGTYRTPRVRVRAVLSCEVRDCDVVVTGYTDARIPWPVGYPRERGGSPAPVVYGALAQAVGRESNQAVCYWFGVTAQTVSKWRKALGVGLTNDGTHRLRSDYTREPWAVRARRKAVGKARDPDRRRKIAEARRGKKRPTHVVEAVRRAHLGWTHTPEARAKLSAAMKERAKVFVPNGRTWTAAEDDLLRTLPPAAAARETGRGLGSVYDRRRTLKVPDGRRG
jgi:hypothetical protein